MSKVDLGQILDDLAAGRIDAQEASRRIEAAKRAAEQAETVGETPADTTRRGGPKAGGLARISVTAVGRRVRIEGDQSVSTLTIEGPHVLRRVGTVMEVSSTGEIGPSIGGFSLIRPPRNWDDLRDIGLGKELIIRVNPSLIVDAEVTTGGLRTIGVPRLGRIRVTAGASTLEDVQEVEDLLSQAGGISVEGPISLGRSRLKVESGSLTVSLAKGANVTIRGEAKLGRIGWPDGGEHVDEYVVGNGSARLDLAVVMGMASVKVEE
ncbi:hypothetical protein SAMN02745244_03142 [Tessaracoccus bendigoensis DSM 12906]|uniref:Uncharacterized protein n=1 Tax=Tessaracoccus bendigoensis DSM 12906 TaxID=1123357 RepID=A0A1M6LQW5_9ACTN|nr:hypothetical protein [Tessaracoccus bendigoensis]SHJ73462.1 hypothetical protein SAMN02745244_03142 [Tessaracoccus bendigoensis DSM 12906]